MWQKVNFILSEIGAALWPFIKRFLQAEARVLMASAQASVVKVAADQSLRDKPWQDKLSAAVALVLSDMASEGVQVGTSMVIDAIQVEYAKFRE